jgi:glycosyltransferase involved in cell wall biosynthesis
MKVMKKFIAEAINGVLMQEFDEVELIIANDCSPD